MRKLALAILFCLISSVAWAQGCGPQNPNCIVPTAPPGTNNNQAASTAFVQANSGGGITSGAATTGCVMGSMVWTDPTTGNVGCDGSLFITTGFIGSTLNGFGFDVVLGSLAVFVYTGTIQPLSGSCAVVAGTQKGGYGGGEFAIPAGNCNIGTAVTITFALAAPVGYVCDAHDVTTPTSIFDQTGVANETTTVTFTIRGVNAAAGDIVKFKCGSY